MMRDYYGDPPEREEEEIWVRTLDGELVPGDDAHEYFGEWFADFEAMNDYAAEIACRQELEDFALTYWNDYVEYLRGNRQLVAGQTGSAQPLGEWMEGAMRGFARGMDNFYDWLECMRGDAPSGDVAGRAV